MKDYKMLLIGLLLSVCFVFLIGATMKSSDVGRYQISAWGKGNSRNSNHGCFVVDTCTGAVKEVYNNIEGWQLGKRFNEIKSKQ